jgi:cysteine desulfurase
MMNQIYLDYNATTPLDPLVLEEMLPYFSKKYGNPSSIHSFGNMAKSALDLSRDRLAAMVNSRPKEITFTTGGSESNNYAIKGIAYAHREKGNHLITTSAEHASCLETFSFLESQGFEVTYLDVDSDGIIDPGQLSESIKDSTILVSCIYANNETGVVNPINRLSAIANEKGVIFHTDAVQTLGKIEVDLKELNVDMASFSSHKIYGPKGVGALYIKMGVNPVSLLHGGGQERGKRSGTENVPGIAGFGKAAELVNQAFPEEIERIKNLKALLKDGIFNSIKGVRINGNSPNKLPNTLNISFDGIEGESLVMNLDMDGIAVSTGSACSEGNVDPSHVLLAMGQSNTEAISSLRLSIGRFTTKEEINKFLDVLPAITERIRKAKL